VLAWLAGGAATGALAACTPRGDLAPTAPATTRAAKPAGRTATPSPGGTPSAQSASTAPDVEVMAGAMILLGFRGTTAGRNPVLDDLVVRHVGALLLAAHDVPSGRDVRNIVSPQQLARLTADLRAAAPGRVLLATDQEGGAVARLGPEKGFPDTRSAASWGAEGDPAATEAGAREMARALVAAGLDYDLAPVVDVDVDPDSPAIGALGRSYSPDPQVVAAQAAAVVRSMRAEGVLTCLKHFPGQGSATGDTHLGFVDVTRTWQPLELDPYRSLLAAGLVDSVMVAHVLNGRYDADLPASLSHATVTGLLRDELGWQGVVVSDDLQMGAIADRWGLRESIRLAITAGTDLLTFGNNLDTFDAALGTHVHDAILDLVRTGDVTQDRLAESWARLTAMAG
jgi:beta-N-acetylhexosaminidase